MFLPVYYDNNRASDKNRIAFKAKQNRSVNRNIDVLNNNVVDLILNKVLVIITSNSKLLDTYNYLHK